MEKDRIETKMVKILTSKTKDLPRKKFLLYSLIYLLFYGTHFMIISYMFYILPERWPYFRVLALVYLFALAMFMFIIAKKAEELEQCSNV